MALRTLILRNKLEATKKMLENLREKDGDFEKREKELETAIEEMNETTTEEDRKTVEDEAEKFQKEKEEHDEKKGKLENEIKGIESELDKEEKKSPEKKEERKKGGHNTVEVRTKFFGMNMQERDALFASEEVKGFLHEVRTCIKEKRALNNIGLTIPDVILPMIRQVTEENSKLIKHVSLNSVPGTSRQNIMGDIPEAYWDEMCASLKEMDLQFYNMEVDGYKVSGFFAVCNAVLEDSDINLMYELIIAIGKAIAKALDKAILYGKDIKMPMGIVTSLLKKTAPDTYPKTGRPWADLSTRNVVTVSNTSGIKMFQEIVRAAGTIDNDYDTSEIVWVMNKTTKTHLIAESMGVNAAAAIAAGMNNAMPVIGGTILEFKYIPDNTIIFGYFKNYKLAERAGIKISQSEHTRFVEDQTLFKGTARYDGDLAIREAFGILGIGAAPNTKSPLFAGETEPAGE